MKFSKVDCISDVSHCYLSRNRCDAVQLIKQFRIGYSNRFLHAIVRQGSAYDLPKGFPSFRGPFIRLIIILPLHFACNWLVLRCRCFTGE